MEIPGKYNKRDPLSIEEYGKKMVGMTFEEILMKSRIAKYQEMYEAYSNKARKGGLGNLIEECYFGYKANNDSRPDFPDAGVELKATPYEIKSDESYKAGERLVLTMISYDSPVEFDFDSSHLWEKCKLLLLVFYLRNRNLRSNLYYRIGFVRLFTPPKVDLAIIRADYKYITEKIAAGKADELSESDTMYLGACTKGSTAEKSRVKQYYPPHKLAMKRAFCYKISYMTFVLNTYIAKDRSTYEPIVKTPDQLGNKSFEEYIIDRINRHAGKTDEQLCREYDREYNCNKAQWIDLAFRMLGIKSNKAQEFEKANITVKAIRLEPDGNMRESMSLPPMKMKEFAKEEWYDSQLYNYFEEKKFLFIVYKNNGHHYVLRGAQMWNMPYHDLNETVYSGWKKAQEIIRRGIKFEVQRKAASSDIRIKNNLPTKKDNRIIHIRPHASERYYRMDGVVVGDKESCGDELPDGRWMTCQSFWLNNDYVIKQISARLK